MVHYEPQKRQMLPKFPRKGLWLFQILDTQSSFGQLLLWAPCHVKMVALDLWMVGVIKSWEFEQQKVFPESKKQYRI